MHIPGKWAYKKEKYNHDFLVIGYDEENFYSVGFVGDGRFKHFKIPNNNFIDAINDTGSSRLNINFFNYNEGVIPKPNIERMLDDLNKYISTSNYLDNQPQNKISYGISALMRVKDYFVDEVVNCGKVYVDKRYSRVLYEHEWVFTQVIDTFLDLEEKNRFIGYANENLNRAKLVHMLGLKMECTKDAKMIRRVAEYIDSIIEDEMRYIPQLTSLLKIKHENGIL